MIPGLVRFTVQASEGRAKIEAWLTGKPAFVEEFALGVGGYATKTLVAMGEATKPGDDVAVDDGVLHRLLVAGVGLERGEQLNAELLVDQRLRVLERQIEERPQVRLDGRVGVVAGGDGLAGEHPRQRVGGEGVRRVA